METTIKHYTNNHGHRALPPGSVIVSDRGRYMRAVPDGEWAFRIDEQRKWTRKGVSNGASTPEPMPANHISFQVPLPIGYHTVSIPGQWNPYA